MNILTKLQEADTREWNKLTDEQRESAKDAAIIELAYDIKMSLKSARNVHRLIMRLDDYEALIAKLQAYNAQLIQHAMREPIVLNGNETHEMLSILLIDRCPLTAEDIARAQELAKEFGEFGEKIEEDAK